MEVCMILYSNFEKWLDSIFTSKLDSTVIALNFNIYETTNSYDIELIGSDEFDEEDEDWACNTVFSSNTMFEIENNTFSNWESALEFISGLIKEYLNKGNNSNYIKSFKGIGVGFIDGDIDILYKHP